MAVCPYGKASSCFPLALSRDAVFGIIAAADAAPKKPRWSRSVTESHANLAKEGLTLKAEVAGYTTVKTMEAGASSVRLTLLPGSSIPPGAGAYLVTIRAPGCSGWLPGLAAPRCGGGVDVDAPSALEVVVFGRPDVHFTALMYLPEDTLRVLLPIEDDDCNRHCSDPARKAFNDDINDDELEESMHVEVRLVRLLLPVQKDCPPQWLRDRFLRLADIAEEGFSKAREAVSSRADELQEALVLAGLKPVMSQAAVQGIFDGTLFERGVSEDERGQWDEEMRLGVNCAAGVEEREMFADLGVIPDKPMLCTQFSDEHLSTQFYDQHPSASLPESGGHDKDMAPIGGADHPIMKYPTELIGAGDGHNNDTEKPLATQGTTPGGYGAASGDGFDTRWLEFNSTYKTHEDSGSGDGTVVNVGINVSGTLQCPLCHQQFTAQTALSCHTKFFHGVEEQPDWLCYPSA